ncbi:hypothetical protein ACIPJN_29015 [Streptomyces sp. NPDC086796]|uniref:hypothetical protein n=1 Tax=Streptomyces sp. NPDC086796 TaxID=3365760 RepID=UPI00380DBC29
MYDELTAVELAEALTRVRQLAPEMTGPLSMVDEATLGWSLRYPQLTQPQQAFSQARSRQWPRTRTEQTWQEVITTADALAAALRELGDVRLARCAAPTGWGSCRRVLAEQGAPCTSQEHLGSDSQTVVSS